MERLNVPRVSDGKIEYMENLFGGLCHGRVQPDGIRLFLRTLEANGTRVEIVASNWIYLCF